MIRTIDAIDLAVYIYRLSKQVQLNTALKLSMSEFFQNVVTSVKLRSNRHEMVLKQYAIHILIALLTN